MRERWGGGFRRGGERAGEVKRCANDSGIGLKTSGPIRDSEVCFESKSGALDTVSIGNPDFHSCENSIIAMAVSFRLTKTSERQKGGKDTRGLKTSELLRFLGFKGFTSIPLF